MECHTRARASNVRKKEREIVEKKEGRSKRERGGRSKIYICRDKHDIHVFVAKKRMLVATKVLLQQNIFVVTKLFSRQIFVATNITFSRQKFCPDKLTFVATNTCLSRQNTSFVATKMILVAAPASDSFTLSHSTIFTDISLMKPEGISLFSVMGQDTYEYAWKEEEEEEEGERGGGGEEEKEEVSK